MGSLDHLLALRAFEAAARNGSYVAAARELNVTPAAVGQQVRALEASLGVPLFRRAKAGASRLTLTEEAHAVLPDLREGFERVAIALRHLRQDRRRASLTVAVSPAFAALWLLRRLGAFRAAHPQVDLRLDIADAAADYRRAGIDLGVRFGPGRWDGFAASLLSDDEVFPVCAPALLDGPRPLHAPADLGGHTLVHDTTVAVDAGVPDWRAWLTTVGCEGIDAANGLRVNATAAAVQAAVAGQGVALGRGLLEPQDLAARRLVRPFAHAGMRLRWGWYVVRPVQITSAAADAVTAWLLAQAAEPRSGASAHDGNAVELSS